MNGRDLAGAGFAAIVVSAFVGTVLLMIAGGAGGLFFLIPALLAVLLVATAHFLLLGLPLALLVAMYGRIRWWNSGLAGALVGGVPLPGWILLTASDLDSVGLFGVLPMAFLLGTAGLAGGLAFRWALGESDLMHDPCPIILFDGVCMLCTANARFVLRHDRRGHFRLASEQSEAGRTLCRRFGVDPDNPETMLVIEGGRARRDSDAVLAIAEGLGWPWRTLGALRLVPRGWRDGAYRRVARNRYRLFGRRETCWVPSPEQRERIL